jgi:hypothetical protein
MAKPKASLLSVGVATIVGILIWLTVLAMFGIRFPVVGVKWSEVPPLNDPRGKPEGVAPVDPSVQNREVATIALNTPRQMNLNETAVVELLLGLTTPSNELEKKFETVGVKEFARIHVSERMEARLTGTNFAVVATAQEEQAIPRTDVAGWKWKVKPTSEGRHTLHLTVSALDQIEEGPAQRVLRALDKWISIEVAGQRPLWSYTDVQESVCTVNSAC